MCICVCICEYLNLDKYENIPHHNYQINFSFSLYEYVHVPLIGMSYKPQHKLFIWFDYLHYLNAYLLENKTSTEKKPLNIINKIIFYITLF